ncbi:hypothetical protein Plec18167_001805 [Paecilomyces lecythidis]|uniref:Uncharacterized protein n=1 Tax=Paecilomyces lecythidis TaxID=3004212 RepID=A0ABR3YBG7_9EURO
MSSDSDRTDLGLEELNGLDVVSYQRRWDEIYHKTIRQIQQIKEGEKDSLHRDHPSIPTDDKK